MCRMSRFILGRDVTRKPSEVFLLFSLYISNRLSFKNPKENHGSAVGIETGYGLDERGFGVRVPVGSRIFTSPNRSHRLWGPPSLLWNRYRGFFLIW
jgi:hypothetical protein